MRGILKYVQLAPTLPALEAIQIPQGEQGAGLHGLCRMVSISYPAQITRIRRDPDLSAALQYVTIDTPGGPQSVVMLASWAIAVWAAGLHTSRLSAEKQEAVTLLKQQAYTAIARAFSQPEMAESDPIPTAPAPELSSVQAAFDHIQQGFEVLKEGFGELQEGFEILKEGFGGLKEHTVGMDQRLIIVEQDRLGRRLGSGARLSAAQIGQLFMQLALLREQTGISIEDAEKRLAEEFKVAHITDIDASEWPALTRAILALFNR